MKQKLKCLETLKQDFKNMKEANEATNKFLQTIAANTSYKEQKTLLPVPVELQRFYLPEFKANLLPFEINGFHGNPAVLQPSANEATSII